MDFAAAKFETLGGDSDVLVGKLKTLTNFGLSGVIIGKALYENKINLNEALNLFKI